MLKKPVQIKKKSKSKRSEENIVKEVFDNLKTKQKECFLIDKIGFKDKQLTSSIKNGSHIITSEDLKHLTVADIAAIFRKKIYVEIIKNYFDEKAFSRFHAKLKKKEKDLWACGNCTFDLYDSATDEVLVQCSACLAWYHKKCTNFMDSQFWFCNRC